MSATYKRIKRNDFESIVIGESKSSFNEIFVLLTNETYIYIKRLKNIS